MKEVAWGLPKKINLSKIVNSVPSSWVSEYEPIKGTTKLTPTAGAERKAEIEGGGIEAYARGKNSYIFEYEVRVLKGRAPKIESADGTIDGLYAVQLIPENPTVEGFTIDCAAVHVEETWDAEIGTKHKYVFTVLVPPTGAQVKWGVQSDKTAMSVNPVSLNFASTADSTGKTITAASTGDVSTVASSESWCTVTKAGKIATVKVAANTGVARTAVVTLTADGMTATTTVSQAGS